MNAITIRRQPLSQKPSLFHPSLKLSAFGCTLWRRDKAQPVGSNLSYEQSGVSRIIHAKSPEQALMLAQRLFAVREDACGFKCERIGGVLRVVTLDSNPYLIIRVESL